MNESRVVRVQGAVVEDDVHLTLLEICQACSIDEEQVLDWIAEGLLEPAGESRQEWRFGGDSLRRARLACRLSRDLAINPAGIALAVDLLEQIAELRARLQRAGIE